MEDKRVLNLEELESVSGGSFYRGELTEKDVALLNSFIIAYKDMGYSKNAFYEKWKEKSVSEETLAYIDANWEKVHH